MLVTCRSATVLAFSRFAGMMVRLASSIGTTYSPAGTDVAFVIFELPGEFHSACRRV
jgi:hypothetical protein